MVIITVGNKCEFAIDRNNHLLLIQNHRDGFMVQTIDLGLATTKRIEEIQDYLGRLACHAVEEKVIG